MYAYVHIIFDDSAFGWLISGSDCSLVTSSFVRVRGTCIRNSKYLVGPGRWGAFFLFFLLIPFGVMSANPSFRFSWLRPGTAWPCRMWWSGSNGATWLMSLGYAVAFTLEDVEVLRRRAAQLDAEGYMSMTPYFGSCDLSNLPPQNVPRKMKKAGCWRGKGGNMGWKLPRRNLADALTWGILR